MATLIETLALAERRHQAGDLVQAEQLFRQVVQSDPSHARAWYFLGAVCHSQGKLGESENCLRRALHLQPNHAEGLDHLGRVLREQGKCAEAVHCFQEALKLEPGRARTLNRLGITWVRLGKRAEAEDCFRQAAALAPDNPDAHNNLGNVLDDQGRWDEATLCFRQALHLRPDNPLFHNNLGNTLLKQGRRNEAIISFQQSLRLQPNSAAAHGNLARAFWEQERYDDALTCCRQALRLRPDDAELLRLLGVLLSARGQLDEGIDSYRQAVRVQPGHAQAHRNLGQALEQQGKLEEAVNHFHEALRLQPTAVDYFHLSELASLGRCPFPGADVQRVEALLAEAGTPVSERTLLHFTLGNVLARRGASDEAFTHYRQGNDLARLSQQQRGLAFDVEKHRAIIDELEAVYHPGYFQRVKSFGIDTELPIFIVGMPRSGTTLVEQILSNHPQVMGAGELKLIPQMKTSVPRTMRAAEGYPACMRRIDRSTVQALAEGYLQSITRIGGPALRVTDKLPANFLHLGLIHTLFPRARIIHCRRHPLDVCLSCYFQHFDDIYFAFSQEDLAGFYRNYVRLMAHWRAVLPATMFEIRYEELVGRQEALSRDLVAFCGLEWNDRCLAFHENPRAVQTASKVQVRQPIYGSSVGRWKKFEKHLQPLIEALGDLTGET